MTQPHHSASRGPTRRRDSTRPPSTRSGAGRGGDRRPYPTAPTTTKRSPAKPRSTSAKTAPGGASTPTPATVWAAGPTPIDLDATWPTALVSKIITSFSEPGARVVLLPWPSTGEHPRLTALDADPVIDQASATEHDGEIADALAAIEGLGRTGSLLHIPADCASSGPKSRPFWADLVDGPGNPSAASARPTRSDHGTDIADLVDTAAASMDLIIISLRPEDGGDHTSDPVALLAARVLRVGGILVVLTHSDWTAGELVDPSGPVVASAQNADLLYLQHVVALHTPIADRQFAAELDRPAAETEARSRHRASVSGLPAPHRRIHSDVLVFAQPHDHRPPAADAAFDTGLVR